MYDQNQTPFNAGSAYTEEGQRSTVYDAGLRTHMQRVFNHVGAGLAISGIAAFSVYSIAPLAAIFMNPIVSIILLLVWFGFMWIAMNPNKLMRQSVATVQTKYYASTLLLGLTMAYIFASYTGDSVVRVFFITAAMFLGISLVGYTTKRDLTKMSSFLMMGLIGLIVASIVNAFLGSATMSFAISVIAVLVFTGLIAYETQTAKRLYNENNSDENNQKLAVISAVGLYINFINLFQHLLHLLGNRQ